MSLFGKWTVSPAEYVSDVRRWSAMIGAPTWAATQDYMCEPFILERTGLTVEDHIKMTVESYLELSSAAPEIPWSPCVQGFAISEYEACINEYQRNGVDLTALPVVGIGSVCRRQGSTEIVEIAKMVHDAGIKAHGFGVKLKGLGGLRSYLVSTDSMAWSLDARRADPLEGCTHMNCANCLKYALKWREKCL